MATALPKDFKEFLRLLNSNSVRYLLIGGYAINFYGYSRNTEDLDVWVAMAADNAEKIAAALQALGFLSATQDLFLEKSRVVRMGVPPMRIELLTTISGVEFESCYARRHVEQIDEIEVSIISPEDLRTNKLAAGRLKDLADAERLDIVRSRTPQSRWVRNLV
jgi:hypothetical protein